VPPIGPNTLTATFTPTDTVHYTTATATVTLTVVPATPVVTVTSSSSNTFLTSSVTFTATVSSAGATPTGTMIFYDGTTQIGTAVVTGGVATITTSTLTGGTQAITAAYSGDTNYQPATSASITETVQDFTVALSGANGSTGIAPAGGIASYPLAVTPVGASTLPADVKLTITGLPLGATAVFTPTPVMANSPATSVTLQVMLPKQALAHPMKSPFSGGVLPVALGLILLPFAGRLRKTGHLWSRMAMLALVGIALAVGVTGCGGSIKAESYTLTVTGTSGLLTHSINVNLTIQ